MTKRKCVVCKQIRDGRCWGYDAAFGNIKAAGVGSRFAKQDEYFICWECKQKLDKGEILDVDDELSLNP